MNTQPELPIPISLVNDKYLIFDITAVSYLRREHHICGVMAGTLPQNPSQNMFLGLPMQLMPEEAQLLIEKGIGYILDDPRAHDQAIRDLDQDRCATYMGNIRWKAQQASKIRSSHKEAQKKIALTKQKGTKPTSSNPPHKILASETQQSDVLVGNDRLFIAARLPSFGTPETNEDSAAELFSPATEKSDVVETDSLPLVTPTTSVNFLPQRSSISPTHAQTQVHNLPPSYALYKHLNSKAYFTTPGLRFGCQYCVYPGDPLRFHSHFLAMGYRWDDEIDLMDVVGGGRLGTGVKKGWLLGGEEPPPLSSVGEDLADSAPSQRTPNVRTFSVEWAAM